MSGNDFLKQEKMLGEDRHTFFIHFEDGRSINLGKKMDEHAQKVALDFQDWLMTNCELSEDQTIWSYNSEDYSLEGIFEVFKNQ